ncbi:MAG: tetratricopeptide repeat protein [Desulfatibacillum sp.]|nr:tetratricopeptide repeat protein [Desulfatibacillum sp.]
MNHAAQGFPRILVGFLVFLFLLTGFPCPGFSGEVLTIDADNQLAFAEKNFAEGEYYRAISEYRRFLHFFPGDERAASAAFRIGQSYYLGEDYPEAQKAFETVKHDYPQSPLAKEASLLICQCHVKIQDFEEARDCLSRVIQGTDSSDVADRARYDAGWVYVREGQFSMASDTFSGMSQAAWEKYRIPSLLSGVEKAGGLKHKEPVAAGVLAIVPGLGHVYTKRYQDAAIAFLLNAGLILAAYESFDNDQEALGSVIGLVGFGFYAGNIYSAVSSAHKYNKREQAAFTKSLEQYKVRVSVGALSGGSGPGASLTIPF